MTLTEDIGRDERWKLLFAIAIPAASFGFLMESLRMDVPIQFLVCGGIWALFAIECRLAWRIAYNAGWAKSAALAAIVLTSAVFVLLNTLLVGTVT